MPAGCRASDPRQRCCQRRSEMGRSEEHTSELQSRSDLVCRLLLEKKNKKKETERLKPTKAATITTQISSITIKKSQEYRSIMLAICAINQLPLQTPPSALLSTTTTKNI